MTMDLGDLRKGSLRGDSRSQPNSTFRFLEAGIIPQIVELRPSFDHNYIGLAVRTSLLQGCYRQLILLQALVGYDVGHVGNIGVSGDFLASYLRASISTNANPEFSIPDMGSRLKASVASRIPSSNRPCSAR